MLPELCRDSVFVKTSIEVVIWFDLPEILRLNRENRRAEVVFHTKDHTQKHLKLA